MLRFELLSVLEDVLGVLLRDSVTAAVAQDRDLHLFDLFHRLELDQQDDGVNL